MTISVDLDELEVSQEPSVVFTLDGREWACKARGAIPAIVGAALLGEVPMRMDVLYRGLLADDQADEFVTLLGRPDSPLTLDRWRLLCEKLVEAVFNRPTVRSTNSDRGPRRSAGTSKASSSSRGTPRKRRAS